MNVNVNVKILIILTSVCRSNTVATFDLTGWLIDSTIFKVVVFDIIVFFDRITVKHHSNFF